jgi:NRPS condensation-like uncharacterized protein
MTATLVPFTLLDELACYFDDPAEPNNIHFEVHLTGRLDPARLRAAVLDTLAAHPLARVRRGRWHGWDRRLHWEIADRPDVPPVDLVRWQDSAELAQLRRRSLDVTPSLDLAPPLRIRHAVGPEWDALIVNIHHAAMDGLSGLRLLRSIARRYAGRPDPVSADPLAVRVPAARTPKAPRSLRPVARIAPDGGESSPGCGFHLVSIPYHSVHNGSSTVNDVLLAALVIAVTQWNAEHGQDAGTVRITLPVNARVDGNERLGNLSRLAVIANDPTLRGNGLLADVVRQTVAVKSTAGPQIDAFTALLAAPWLPVAVKAKLPALALRLAGAASDTTLLSNLGAVDDPPDFGAAATVNGLWMSPPVRMPRGVAIGAATVRDQLHLCFRYRLAQFDERAAARFAATFHTALCSFHDPRFGSGS